MRPALRTVLLALGVTVGAFGLARAYYANIPTNLQAPTWAMAPGTVTTLSPGSATETHTTLSAKGQCIRFSCTVDVSYVFSASGSPTTLASTAAGNDLPAKTVETRCLPGTQDYVSIYTSAAGTCKVSELASP